jgi:transcriptional regulator with XRE-family HTH domain
METNNLKEKMAQLVSKEPSKWVEEAKWRSENRAWLKRSQAVAIKVLFRLDELKMSQKALAESLNVTPQYINKVVKGKENLTLEAIAKLESALSIELMFISSSYNYVFTKNIYSPANLIKTKNGYQAEAKIIDMDTEMEYCDDEICAKIA